MRTYCAVANKHIHWNGWHGCFLWAQEIIGTDPAIIVKIHVARPDQKLMRVVSEITNEGVRHIENGRSVPVSKVKVRYG